VVQCLCFGCSRAMGGVIIGMCGFVCLAGRLLELFYAVLCVHDTHMRAVLTVVFVDLALGFVFYVLVISAKWTEWNWRRLCLHFCVFVCVHSLPLVWMGGMLRNVFDSCVKSWEYFRMDNISLESLSHWLSDDRFKIEVGVLEKCTKNVTLISCKMYAI